MLEARVENNTCLGNSVQIKMNKACPADALRRCIPGYYTLAGKRFSVVVFSPNSIHKVDFLLSDQPFLFPAVTFLLKEQSCHH